MKTIKTNWEKRNCPVCDSEEYQKLDERKYTIQQRVSKFEITLEDALCINCGVLYEKSIPEPEFLNHYYEEAHTRKSDIVDIRPDFNIENRLSLLKEYLAPGSKIIEIGANDGAFLSILKEMGFDANGYDPLMNKDDDGEKVQKMFISGEEGLLDVASNQLCDAIISYFVLEHITEPRKWIAEIVKTLKKNGLVIMEVPNFALFPRESFYYEHFSHFTEFHLKALFINCGMEILHLSDVLASRYFGIVVVARYTGNTPVVDYPKETFDATLGKYEENKINTIRINEVFESISREVRDKKKEIEGKGKKAPVYFWGANDISAQFILVFKNFLDTAEVYLIDSSSEKNQTMFAQFEHPVQYPITEVEDNVVPIFIICSFNYFDQIKKMIVASGFKEYCIFDGTSPFK